MNLLKNAVCIAALATGLAGQKTADAAKSAEQEPRAFMRLVENEQGGWLEVLVATYTKGDASVTLFGCVHIADPTFYKGMQKRFESYDALLYELIGPKDLRPYPGMPSGDHWLSMVQDGMGSGLKLKGQFECMDYRQDNFVHADMTGRQWQRALKAAGKSEIGEMISVGPQDVDREKEAKQQPVNLVKAFRSGGGISQLRIVMGRAVCSPDATGQPTVIIHGRNERCLEVLQDQLQAGKKKLGIFYGAAHLAHMEERLTKDMGFRKEKEEWVQAWDCRHSSFPKAEKGLKTKRYRARKDLRQLVTIVKNWCRQHEDDLDNGRYPDWATLRKGCEAGKLPGRDDGRDSWGREYVLRFVKGGFEIRCLGSDGKADTEDDLVESTVEKKKKSLLDRLFGRGKSKRR